MLLLKPICKCGKKLFNTLNPTEFRCLKCRSVNIKDVTFLDEKNNKFIYEEIEENIVVV